MLNCGLITFGILILLPHIADTASLSQTHFHVALPLGDLNKMVYGYQVYVVRFKS